MPHKGARQAVEVLCCVECDAPWLPDDATRWRAYLTSNDPPELLVYCDECAAREFDSPPA